VVQALSNALESGRLHHAYMFNGTRGVGKTTVSRILAKALNCVGPDGQGGLTATPCGVCSSCRDIDLGRFVDYTELDAASNRGVDEVQSLLEQAVYKPVQGRYKVFMIDEVHMLTGHAFNAMLKTLEEPPEYLKFVLATTDPQKVPVTVLSRCLQFNLKPIAPQVVEQHLQTVMQAEGLATQDFALGFISRAARGSMRDALSLLDQAIAFGGVNSSVALTEHTVRQMLGAVDKTYVLKLLAAIADVNGVALIKVCDGLRLEGFSASATIDELTRVLQRIAVLQATQNLSPHVSDASDPEITDFKILANALPADVVQLIYSIALHGRQELGLAPDEYAALNMILLRALVFMPKKPAGSNALSVTETLGQQSSTILISETTSATPEPAAPSIQFQNSQQAADLKTNVVAHAVAPNRLSEAVSNATAVANPHPAVAAPNPDLANVSPSLRALVQAAPQPTSVAPTAQVSQASQASPTESASTSVAQQSMRQLPVRTLSDPEVMPEQELQHLTPNVVVVKPQYQATEAGDFWLSVVKDLIKKELVNAFVRELALQSQLIARDQLHAVSDQNSQAPEQWHLRVERESLIQGTNKDRLEQALSNAGWQVKLIVEVGAVSDNPVKRLNAQKNQLQDDAIDFLASHPWVQTWVNDWDAKLINASVQIKPKTMH
jgi:DNA polymerase-3 subunit gamma/tau